MPYFEDWQIAGMQSFAFGKYDFSNVRALHVGYLFVKLQSDYHSFVREAVLHRCFSPTIYIDCITIFFS